MAAVEMLDYPNNYIYLTEKQIGSLIEYCDGWLKLYEDVCLFYNPTIDENVIKTKLDMIL